ncbi:hypothetical protein, partial [Deinococcus marmoris]|uniref:hypothetical protein n=1 Tax=Deinococcus marmoris TaxID=249408 RepID=UPI001C37E31D
LVRNLKSTNKVFKDMHIKSIEPLLQHYGIQTTWLDLVDNIWIALWFSCYKAVSSGKDGKYLNFERRSERKENKTQRYAYIILVAADLSSAKVISPGIWKGINTELIDLRLAAPSIFLRPHAQHGLLFRNLGKPSGRDSDYSSSIAGIVRVDLADALDWLGNGNLLDTHSLFPPASYDSGYEILLEIRDSLIKENKISMGNINYIGT